MQKFKAANRDKIVIRLKDCNVLVIDKIEPPKFYIQGAELTEYDVRNLMVQVNAGNVPHTLLNALKVTDDKGKVLVFLKNGRLETDHEGFHVLTQMTLKILKSERIKSKN